MSGYWKTLVAGVALAGCTSSIAIADGAPPSTQSWTGCYAGAQVGYGWADISGLSNNVVGALAGGGYSYNVDGPVFGGHMGCNYQFQSIVIGIEGDIEKSLIDGNRAYILATTLRDHSTDFDWQASIRGRLGFASGSALYYVTGGWAWAETESVLSNLPLHSPILTYSTTRDGWTLGAGIENQLAANLTGRIEYRYTELDGMTGAQQSSIIVDRQKDSDLHTIRLGLSVKFH